MDVLSLEIRHACFPPISIAFQVLLFQMMNQDDAIELQGQNRVSNSAAAYVVPDPSVEYHIEVLNRDDETTAEVFDYCQETNPA